MNYLLRHLECAAGALRAAEARFALVGGLAVGALAESRFTRDVDFAIAVDEEREADRLVAHLRRRGYEPLHLFENERLGRLATVRLVPPGAEADQLLIDLLFATNGIESEIVADAVTIEIAPGLTLPIARVGHLIAMKLLARDDRRRPADFDDLTRLIDIADSTELERARRAVRLIAERGYARARDLAADLERLVETRGP